MSKPVFAYGSNMCSGRFRAYRIQPEQTGRAAVLSGYRLVFDNESIDRSGKANLEPHGGSETWGVIYLIPDTDLQKLDDGEVGYHRMLLPVRTASNTAVEACVYIASAQCRNAALRPYTWYKRFLVEGAREHLLPAEYIAALESIDAVQDADTARDLRKRSLACEAQL
jgi:hypothetical protein